MRVGNLYAYSKNKINKKIVNEFKFLPNNQFIARIRNPLVVVHRRFGALGDASEKKTETRFAPPMDGKKMYAYCRL